MPHSERRRTIGILRISVIKHIIADFIGLRLFIWVILSSQSMFPVLLLTILLFFEFIKLVKSWGVNNDICIECITSLLTTSVVMAKYFNAVFHVRKLGEVCHMIKSDVERLKDFPQFEVLNSYALQGRQFVVSFGVSLCGLMVVYLALPTILIVRDILTKNESETKYMLYQWDYYIIDPQDCYYFTTAHSYAATVMLIIFICTLDSMFITFIQHACAMFAVTGYQIKMVHIMKENIPVMKLDELRYQEDVDAQERMYEKLVACVKEHQRAIECSQIVQAAFSATLFLQIALNILNLSITGIQALVKIAHADLLDVCRLITWLIGQYIHLVYIHLFGQRMSSFSEQVHYDLLECKWNKLFYKSRVVYQFFVMNTLLPRQLTALKVTTLNMETLLSFTQAAVSYFTVLSSTL